MTATRESQKGSGAARREAGNGLAAKSETDGGKPKWATVFEALQKSVRNGDFPTGVPLPSEKALMQKFGVSRITVVRAMNELCRRGIVSRRRGSGTFAMNASRRESGPLGLILPGMSSGEIFPVICQALMRLAQRDGYSLVLGDVLASRPTVRARKVCDVARQFIEQGIVGVIFQPLAFLRTPDRVTKEILTQFREANIPVVLIDRNVGAEESSRHDFVGIDNLNAGRALGAHLAERGAKRVSFLMRPKCASVIRDRRDGVFGALEERGLKGGVIVAEPNDRAALRPLFAKRGRPDAVVCESDYVAAQLIGTLASFGLSVPKDVRVAGFDDLRCATYATPNLTTVHQPCEDIAQTAYRTLRERLHDEALPVRRILLPAPLVVRESTR